ncbi:hypothetical protein M8C21_022173 [Ambrosia artemisiifolia]|uniref:Protein FAR1-RELATED SEQUENCE n=1 Tax=Ambrosia artemisiifolia TaxID=4212 RepID=A0AAD5GX82_AMBAR|nr:hypothetical protein M8C21_022173 [Ambrosia artemisiifolia]
MESNIQSNPTLMEYLCNEAVNAESGSPIVVVRNNFVAVSDKEEEDVTDGGANNEYIQVGVSLCAFHVGGSSSKVGLAVMETGAEDGEVTFEGSCFSVKTFNDIHNHNLFEQHSRDLNKISRKLSYSTKQFIHNMSLNRIGPVKAHRLDSQRYRQRVAECKTSSTVFVGITELPIEQHAFVSYTHAVFEEVKKEIVKGKF